MDGHDQVRVFTLHELHQQGVVGVTGDDDGLAVLAFLKGILGLIDTQWFASILSDRTTWFTASGIRSVTVVASLGENGLDLLVKRNRFLN